MDQYHQWHLFFSYIFYVIANLGFQSRNSSSNFPFAAGGWSVVLIFEYPTNMVTKKYYVIYNIPRELSIEVFQMSFDKLLII